MKRCASGKAHWEDHGAAMRRLRAIQDNPAPGRLYVPTAVTACHCGGYVLTSKGGKPKARGKSQRGRSVSTRRR